MKHVSKGEPPASFEEWKAKANEDWQPAYGNLQNPQKSELHDALLREQGWVCCYCGCGISKADSHIEHFRPQSGYPDQALSFDNLFASCLRDIDPGSPLHCGHAKANGFDEKHCVSPLEDGCEQRFTYKWDGRMEPEPGDVSAEYMRGLLKLDIAFLCDERANVLQNVFDPVIVETVTDSELVRLRDAFRMRDQTGHALSFGHVVARYAEQLLASDAG